MDKGATMASYTASIGTAAGGLLSLNSIALLLGILFAAGTFFINWRAQKKRIELELAKRQEDKEFHEARMREINKQDQLVVNPSNVSCDPIGGEIKLNEY